MGIKWTKDGKSTKTTHQGLVVSPPWVNRSVRVMSDVWEDQTLVYVWDPEEECVKSIVVYTTGFSSEYPAEIVVDAPAHIIADHNAAVARRERVKVARKELEAQETANYEAMRDLKEVVCGREVVVVKGRKVPVGTRGIAKWVGATEWGYRVGIAVAGQDKLTYTSTTNCEAIVPGLKPDESPVGGWVAFRDALLAAERATLASRPSKGHRVRIIADGTEGTMFWINGDRCGVDPRPAKEQRGRCPNPIWLQVNEVERLDGSRSTIVAPPIATPAPKKEVLPSPYDKIAFIDGDEGLNRYGDVVASLTPSGKQGLLTKNPDIKVLI